MTDQEKIALAASTIRDEIFQLEAWADESLAGGWSTHQVKPQRERAMMLARILLNIAP